MEKTIKPGKWNETNDAVSNLYSDLEQHLEYGKLPKKVATSVRSLMKEIDDMAESKPKTRRTLTGKILTIKEVKEIAENSTGYKWKASKLTDEERVGQITEPIPDRFGVDVGKKVVVVSLERDARSRDELDMLDIVCMPDHVYVEWNTGRVSAGSDIIIPNKALRKYLKELN